MHRHYLLFMSTEAGNQRSVIRQLQPHRRLTHGERAGQEPLVLECYQQIVKTLVKILIAAQRSENDHDGKMLTKRNQETAVNSVELICGEILLKKNRTFVESNILYAVPIKSISKKMSRWACRYPCFLNEISFS